jgi:hypothetical protein
MEVSGQLHALAALTLGKEFPVPLIYEAELAPELVWMLGRREKSPDPAGNLSAVIQPTANHYSD